MSILYFDCFSGISGDMVLGALIDCGIDYEIFKGELAKLNISGYNIEIKKSSKNGITGTDVNVQLEKCEHGEHQHRNISDIEGIINKSGITENAKDISKKIFRKLAEAEGKVHGKGVEEVHFHEVGAVDSIVDIVGCAICIDILHIDSFACSMLNVGRGFVKCQHGIIPVPGPAVVELLRGIPVFSLDINTELVTPTGAAIVSTLCTDFGPIPQMVIEKAGYGLGKKNLEIPNLLRIIIGDVKKKPIA